MAEIVIICDEPLTRRTLAGWLRDGDHVVREADDVSRAVTLFAASPCDVVLLAGAATKRDAASEALTQAKIEWPGAEVILLADYNDVRGAVDAIRQGAYDYLLRSIDRKQLLQVVGAAARAESPSGSLDVACGQPDEIAADPLTRALFAKADRAAALGSAVLITGESGTGKEVLARRIHRQGPRRRSKFVPVNCGSIPETLIETELFGYRKGAFTGAVTNTTGLIAEAAGGTLFLDEIGDMPIALQCRLLRFLDSGEIRQVGSTSVQHVDVRVIAATNRCVTSDIEAGRFRMDLYYRVSAVSLHLPPLRERKGDIYPLAEFYLRRAALRARRAVPSVSGEVRSLLETYHWPGNVRELQNVMEQGLIHCSRGVIVSSDLPDTVLSGASRQPATPVAPKVWSVQKKMRRRGAKRNEVAAALGISRTTLWRRLRRDEMPALLDAGFPRPEAAHGLVTLSETSANRGPGGKQEER